MYIIILGEIFVTSKYLKKKKRILTPKKYQLKRKRKYRSIISSLRRRFTIWTRPENAKTSRVFPRKRESERRSSRMEQERSGKQSGKTSAIEMVQVGTPPVQALCDFRQMARPWAESWRGKSASTCEPSPSLPSTQLTCPLPPPIEIRRNDGSCPRECFRPRPLIARRGNGVAGRKIRRGRKSVGNRHFLREPSLHAAQGEREGVERAWTRVSLCG